MKYSIFSFLFLVTSLSALAGGPTLDGGLSIHIIPDRFPESGATRGFVVTTPIPKQPSKVFLTAKELVDYIVSLPKSDQLNIPRNGIWIYSDGADFYSPATIKEYDKLLSLCSDHHIGVWLGETTWRPALPNLQQKP
jgi:hypothetical protein